MGMDAKTFTGCTRKTNTVRRAETLIDCAQNGLGLCSSIGAVSELNTPIAQLTNQQRKNHDKTTHGG